MLGGPSWFPPLPFGAAFWLAVTRLGEAQVMLPATCAALLWLALRPAARPLVGWWLATLGLAVLLTKASKVAFIGWGLGSAALDFTGVSGHAMFATAVYPLLLRVLVADRRPAAQGVAMLAGLAVALVVGLSRLIVHAHSFSEVAAGWALGGAAGAAAFRMARLPRLLRLPVWLPAVVVVWVLCLGHLAPPSRSHDMVTRLSLALSGHRLPYTRQHLLHPRPPEPHAPDEPAWIRVRARPGSPG